MLESCQKLPDPKRKNSNKKRNYVENIEAALNARQRAQKIFMDTISTNVTKEKLKNDLKFISAEHLYDIAEERSLSEICGYPLCTNGWKDKFGKRRYIIKSNTVYNIELRKFFCSDKCFHGYEILNSQLLKTPLFLRSSDDTEFANLEIIFPDLTKLTGKYGTPVDCTVPDHTIPDEIRGSQDLSYITDFDICDMENEDVTCASGNKMDDAGMEEVSKKKENFFRSSDDVRQDGKILQQENVKINNVAKETEAEVVDNCAIYRQAITVEQRLKEMISFETLILIIGESYVRGMLEHVNKSYDDYAGLHLGLQADESGSAVNTKLDKIDIPVENESVDDERVLSDLSNIEQLTKDTEACTIKVKSYFGTDNKQENLSKEVEEELSLPFIDSYSIMTWRRKIFFDKLNKYLPFHVNKMKLNVENITEILRPIIYSLELNPHNIYFTPSQWSLVCLAFLKMLSVRYAVIEASFLHYGRSHMIHVLGLFNLDNLYLDRLLTFLTELDYILAKSIPKLSQN